MAKHAAETSESDCSACLVNMTPHEVVIFPEGVTTEEAKDSKQVKIPSSGALRLLSKPQQSISSGLSHGGVQLPVITAQDFIGIDPTSKGYELLRDLTAADAIIVSIPTAQWFMQHADENKFPFRILVPATGPGHAVRDKDGKLLGTLALEQYC